MGIPTRKMAGKNQNSQCRYTRHAARFPISDVVILKMLLDALESGVAETDGTVAQRSTPDGCFSAGRFLNLSLLLLRKRRRTPDGCQRAVAIDFGEGLRCELLIIHGSGETNTHLQIIEGKGWTSICEC